MKKALVTGATGFVGINLCQQLLAQGWQLHILCRPTSNLDPLAKLPLTKCVGDVTDLDSVTAAIPEQCDAIFHVAASTSLWKQYNQSQQEINVGGTRNIIQAALQKRVTRLIHTSSFAVWGFQPNIFNEQSPWVKEGSWINYIKTKRQAEKLVKAAHQDHGLDVVILNPGHILGPHDQHNWSRMIRLIDTNKLPGVPPGNGSFADVREVAKAHIAAYDFGESGSNYLLGGQPSSYLELSHKISKILGRKPARRETPAFVIKSLGRINQWLSTINNKEPDISPESAAMVSCHLLCDSSKAVAKLNYNITAIDELLDITVDWMHENNMLITDDQN